jgi:hypothetical protein
MPDKQGKNRLESVENVSNPPPMNAFSRHVGQITGKKQGFVLNRIFELVGSGAGMNLRMARRAQSDKVLFGIAT